MTPQADGLDVNHGPECCCDPCWDRFRASLPARFLDPRPRPGRATYHGTWAGYTKHGCREECCRSESTRRKREWRARKRAEAKA